MNKWQKRAEEEKDLMGNFYQWIRDEPLKYESLPDEIKKILSIGCAKIEERIERLERWAKEDSE